MMLENDCGMLQNGAAMEISPKHIKDLEMSIPDLKDRIASNEPAKDPEFLEIVW